MSTSRCCCGGGGSTPSCCPSEFYTWESTVCSFHFDNATSNPITDAVSTGNNSSGATASISLVPGLLSARQVQKGGLLIPSNPRCGYFARYPQPSFCSSANVWASGNPFTNGAPFVYQTGPFGPIRQAITRFQIYYWVTPWEENGISKWEQGLTISMEFVNFFDVNIVTKASISNGWVSGAIISGTGCPTGNTWTATTSCASTSQTLQRGHARQHRSLYGDTVYNFCSPLPNDLPGLSQYGAASYRCPVTSSFVGTIT